ncbi:hypothetical protein ACMFMG_002473 [Clarireedia jacksonii]
MSSSMIQSHESKAEIQQVSDLEIAAGKTSKNGILLRPQPTNDPNDPLNWTSTKKYATYITICIFAFLTMLNSSNFTLAIIPVAHDLHTSTTRAGYLTSLQLLAMGLGNLFWVPLIRITGKRPAYLISLLLLAITNIWGYFCSTYANLLVSRLIGGFAVATADAPVPGMVADLFFFHERGHCMMMFHTAFSTGVFLGPLINGYIVQYAGWRWMLGFTAIAASATFLVGIFTIHESAYAREKADLNKSALEYPPERSWKEELSLTLGYDREASFGKWVWSTLAILGYPPVLVVGLTIGVCVGWNISVQLTSTLTFTAAPYHWSTHQLGLLSISGFIGAVISFFIGGHLIDIIATRMTAHKGGSPEPEYRLLAMIFPALIGPMGVLTFGLVIAHQKHWIGAAAGYAMLGFGLNVASNVVVTYAVDAYRPVCKFFFHISISSPPVFSQPSASRFFLLS